MIATSFFLAGGGASSAHPLIIMPPTPAPMLDLWNTQQQQPADRAGDILGDGDGEQLTNMQRVSSNWSFDATELTGGDTVRSCSEDKLSR